ncbi:MAG: phosphoribosylanthranilate isomerase [Syntrophobacteraceae bacterium]|nr:phosphoribosylanthranilate isomerase [Desulfobacteraceae bacterium]
MNPLRYPGEQSAAYTPERPPQVKVCGLTRIDEATACAELGVDAVGLVFYRPSPRFVTDERAREICLSLPERVCTVGVFVNEPPGGILDRVHRCGLKAVQLHGQEPPGVVDELLRAGVTVIKALFQNTAPAFASADEYGASAFLAECAGGPLPGGNAIEWDWGAAARLSGSYPVVLAGGLNSSNVSKAIGRARPDAVDVSSGVESMPGRKDIDKVKQFLEAVSRGSASGRNRRIFR